MRYIVILAALAGCATDRGWRWYHPNGANYQQDHGFCRAQAFSVPNAPLMQVVLVLDGCMQGKGWQKVAN